MANNNEQSNSLMSNPAVVIVLVVLLVVAAFAVGSMWTKLQSYENGNNNGGSANNGQGGQPENPLAESNLPVLAASIGLKAEEVAACLEANETKELVQANYQGGLDVGVNGTPGNILLNTETGQTALIPGAVPLPMLKTSIDSLLAGELPEGADEANAKIAIAVTDQDHLYGSPDAKIILFEYSDLQCPYCKSFHPTAKQVVADYNGQVAWVYRHFPLDQIHPLARRAAEAAECVAKVGGNDKFWEYLDVIYES